MDQIFPTFSFPPKKYWSTMLPVERPRPRPEGLRPQPVQRKRLFPSESEDDDDIPLAPRTKRRTNKPSMDADHSSSVGSLSATSQTTGNTTDKPIIISDTESSSSSPPPPPPSREKATSGPIMVSPPVSPPAVRTKSATKELDIDSEAEEERELLSRKAELDSMRAKILSAEARLAFLKTCKRNRDARKMTAALAASMSETENREDALRAELVDAKTVSDEKLNELYGVKEGYDDWMVDFSRKVKEVGVREERRKKLKEFINLIEEKVQRQTEVHDREGEAKLMEENDEDDDKTEKMSSAKVDEDDGDDDKTEKMSGAKVDEGDGDNDEKYESDEDDYDSLDGFIVYDDSDDEDYEESDDDDEYHGDGGKSEKIRATKNGGDEENYESEEYKPDSVDYDRKDGLDVNQGNTNEEDILDLETMMGLLAGY
ncbi:hypothetical protein V501_06635 [Pseudogymnoascus sp. VKM F-4519 (FW-2642)]|nr:hypothetical protein V501_06635 [Pseudogymnoascus sp. VKM F-4519 (FW-2642)]